MADVLWYTIPAFALGAAGFAWSNRRASPSERSSRWLKFCTYGVIVHAVLAVIFAGQTAAGALMSLLAIGGLVEILRARRTFSQSAAAFSVVAAIFAACGFGAVIFALESRAGLVAFVYLVVAGADGFSQVGGQIAGRRRLVPVLSPGKTIEGALCGIGAAIVFAWLFRWLAGLSVFTAIALGLVAALAGMAGDLAASWVKRQAGIKDFGHILPGHGGVLDRFDSFFAAAAVLSIF